MKFVVQIFVLLVSNRQLYFELLPSELLFFYRFYLIGLKNVLFDGFVGWFLRSVILAVSRFICCTNEWLNEKY